MMANDYRKKKKKKKDYDIGAVLFRMIQISLQKSVEQAIKETLKELK